MVGLIRAKSRLRPEGAVDLAELLNELSEPSLQTIEGRGDLGPLQFAAGTRNVRLIRAWSQAAAAQDPATLYTGLRSEIPAHLTRVVDFVHQMRDFDLTQTANPNEVHRGILDQVEVEKDWFAQTVAPYARAGEIDVAALRAEAVAALEAILQAAAEAQQLLGKIRVSAGTAGAANVSTYYSGQAGVHRVLATRFLQAGAAAIVATLLVAFGAFVLLPPLAEGSGQWLLFTRELVARAFLVGVPAYVAAFALRNYRVNKHLQVVNEQRRTALDTYPLFTESVTDETTRGLIAVELLRATVGITETGYLSDQTERTILEAAPITQLLQRPPTS